MDISVFHAAFALSSDFCSVLGTARRGPSDVLQGFANLRTRTEQITPQADNFS